jgi:hypothetical protein
VGGERHAEGAGQRRDLELGRDAADPDHIRLERMDVLAERESHWSSASAARRSRAGSTQPTRLDELCFSGPSRSSTP